MSARGFSAHDYVLGELSGPELAEAERLVREDPSFAAEVDRLRPVVAELGQVPGDVWAQIPRCSPRRSRPATRAPRRGPGAGFSGSPPPSPQAWLPLPPRWSSPSCSSRPMGTRMRRR